MTATVTYLPTAPPYQDGDHVITPDGATTQIRHMIPVLRRDHRGTWRPVAWVASTTSGRPYRATDLTPAEEGAMPTETRPEDARACWAPDCGKPSVSPTRVYCVRHSLTVTDDFMGARPARPVTIVEDEVHRLFSPRTPASAPAADDDDTARCRICDEQPAGDDGLCTFCRTDITEGRKADPDTVVPAPSPVRRNDTVGSAS